MPGRVAARWCLQVLEESGPPREIPFYNELVGGAATDEKRSAPR